MTDNTTHDKIIDAATSIFAEKGYNGTSMREIAEALDITKAALYYHFSAKEEIFMAIITHSMDKLIDGLEALAQSDGDVWTKLETLISGMCDFSSNRPQKFRLFKQLAEENLANLDMKKLHVIYKRQKDAVQMIIEKGIENGELRDDVPGNMIAAAIVGMVHHTTGPKMREMAGINLTKEEQAKHLLNLIRGGFEKK